MKPVYHMAGFLGSHVPVWDAAPLYDSLNTAVARRDMLVNNIPLGESLAACFASNQDGAEEQPGSGANEKPQASSNPARTVVLMRRHGYTIQAENIEMAVYRAIYTRINAKAQTQSMAVARDWNGTMGVDTIETLGLTDELVEGCTEMNARFQ